jgi:hypothetical protein
VALAAFDADDLPFVGGRRGFTIIQCMFNLRLDILLAAILNAMLIYAVALMAIIKAGINDALLINSFAQCICNKAE